jgi:putative intracellular protease/amidase
MKILMVMTSHSKLGNTGRKTGVWLEELAAPYYVFRDAGLDITLASPRGGHPPIDPRSERPEAQTAATHRLYDDKEAHPVSIELIETMYRVGRPVAAVCHGSAALRHARGIGDFPLVKDKTVTGFTNTEEAAAGLADVVPFRVEDMLRENGGRFTRAPNWFPHSETDGNLITGQNPESAEPTAKVVLLALAAQPFAPPPPAAEPVQPSTRP